MDNECVLNTIEHRGGPGGGILQGLPSYIRELIYQDEPKTKQKGWKGLFPVGELN